MLIFPKMKEELAKERREGKDTFKQYIPLNEYLALKKRYEDLLHKFKMKEAELQGAMSFVKKRKNLDETVEPNDSRYKRPRVSVAEEVMMQRHWHRRDMEIEKVKIEKLRLKAEQDREEQRLNLEKQREDRLKEESQRRDEIAKSQVDLQIKMFDVIQKFMEFVIKNKDQNILS